MSRRVTSSVVAQCVARLRERLVGGEVSQNPNLLAAHGKDESFHEPVPPDVVVFARSTEDVATTLRECNELGVPVIPFGTGTSLEGHLAALSGGVSLDLSQMNQVIEVNAADMDCRVQAGVTRNQLNNELRHDGLWFSVDPGADASLGGMTATAASGTTALRYGTMRENVRGVTVVLPSGEVLKLGGRSRKSSAGLDLKALMVGSEGQLGVITEVCLRLHGQPGAVSAASCPFPTLKDACESVIAITQFGVPVARSELLDAAAVRAVNQHNGWRYPETPTLFFEFHGPTESSVAEQASTVRELCQEHHATAFSWASDESERRRLWEARHRAYYSVLATRPGAKGWPTDVCVPISRLAEAMVDTERDLAEHNIFAPILSHAGDGNYHVTLLVHPDDTEEQRRKLEQFNDRLVRRALALGGTCTGEHGVGYGKADHLLLEHGEGALTLMSQVKRAFDPNNIMNPGKVVPPRIQNAVYAA